MKRIALLISITLTGLAGTGLAQQPAGQNAPKLDTVIGMQQTIAKPIPDMLAPVLRNWSAVLLVSGGRIDAIRQLGGSTILCATRGLNRGKLFISQDYGLTWKFLAQPTSSEITCIGETGNPREFYLLTGNAEVFGTTDGGATFTQLATLTTNKNREKYTASYAIMYTLTGTLLVTDTDSDGGHIYRSTDKGKTWKDLGAISTNALYRLERVGRSLVVNGWAGNIYKSNDDGQTWHDCGHLTNTALFATDNLGDHTLLQADKSGLLFRSRDDGDHWVQIGDLTDAADDFVSIGNGAAWYGTYTGKKNVYFTLDYGDHWMDAGKVLTTAEGDWLDHGISVRTSDSVITLAGTNKGFIIRNAIGKKWLRTVTK